MPARPCLASCGDLTALKVPHELKSHNTDVSGSTSISHSSKPMPFTTLQQYIRVQEVASYASCKGSPLIVLIRQRGGNKGGHFVHQLVWVPTVQYARKAPHITLATCFTFSLDLRHMSWSSGCTPSCVMWTIFNICTPEPAFKMWCWSA